MPITGYKVVGGRMEQKYLTLDLMKKDIKHFEIAKVQIWLNMLKKNMMPVRWYKTTRKGTSIKFDYIDNQDQANNALAELKSYIDSVNTAHGLGLELG